MFLSLAASASAQWNPHLGLYSRHPFPLWDKIAGDPNPLIITAPDGKSSVIASYSEPNGDSDVVLTMSGEIGTGKVDLGPGVGSELVWRSDSRAFFVSTSDRGGIGLYRLVVVESKHGQIVTRDVTPLIHNAFGHPVRCGSPQPPNVGGVAWLPDGHILAAAEIVTHSNCDSFGTFTLYEVDPVAERVIRTYNQLQAKQNFRSLLGQELLAATDECVRTPRKCWVSTNH